MNFASLTNNALFNTVVKTRISIIKSELEKHPRFFNRSILFSKLSLPLLIKLAGLKILISLIILLIAQSAKSQNCSNLAPSFTYTISNSGCSSPDTINFTNTSSGSSVSTSTFYWNVNHASFDTTTSNSSPISIIKTSATYTITLIAITASSCIDSISKTITVQNSISPGFTNIVDTICLGSAMLFTNTSGGTNSTTTYNWTIGNTSFSTNADTASHMFSTAGNYSVSLTANQGTCAYTTSKNITVASGRQPIRFYNNLGMPLHTVTWTRCLTLVTDPDSFILIFASPDTLINYTFDFGDGKSIQGDTLLPYPNGQVSHTYQSTGVFDLIVTTNDLNTCIRTFYGKVINLRYPVVGIGGPDNGHSNGCIPFVTSFKNNSSHVSDCTQFTWNFGDGSTATYNYTNANDTVYHNYIVTNCNINVTLTATNSCGSTQSTWGPINAYTSDIADISANNNVLCQPNSTVTLQNLTQYNCYSGTKFFYWDFGDSSNTGWSSIGIGQSHTYNTPGKYTITFIDSNLCGMDTATQEIIVYGPIQAGLSYSQSQLGCIDYVVTFTDTSVGDSLTYLWDFGDASSSTLQNPTHTFTDTGTYIVSLKVTGICGSSTIYDTLYLYKEPVAVINTIPNGCLPYTVSYTNNTYDYSPFVSYLWDLGDGTSSSKKYPDNVVFATPGTYTTTLIVSDTCGSDTMQRSFTIYKNPIANFGADTVCEGTTTSFYNLSNLDTANGTIVSYKWTFGDNSSSSLENPQHSYSSFGTYQVQLIVNSSFGCSDTISKSIIIKENPSISLSVNPNTYACNLSALNFSASATNSSTSIDTFLWNFGDGNTSYSQNTSYSYTSYGSYNVMLTVVSGNGCSSSTNQQVDIYLPPIANFITDTVCEGNFTNFTNSSSNSNAGNISSYQWDFNSDGMIDDTNRNSTYTFNTTGNYSVKLIITTEYGCLDTVVKMVTVHSKPIVGFNVSSQSTCENSSINFTNNCSNADSFIWNYGDQSNIYSTKSTSTLSHTYTNNGNYSVKLTAFNSQGCTENDSITISIYPNPKADFNSPDYIGCVPFTISFTNNSQDADSFEWFVDGVLKSTASSLSNQTFSIPNDSIEVVLVTKNQFGCNPDTVREMYYTLNNPVPAFSVNSNQGCGPLSVSFTNYSVNALNYLWDFGDGNSSSIENPTHTFQASAYNDTFYVVKLLAYSSSSCIDSISDTISVYASPIAEFSQNKDDGCGPLAISFTNSSIENLNTSSANSILNYVWDFGNGVNSIATDTNIQFAASLTQDSMYTVLLTVTNSKGCSDQYSKSLRVYPKPDVKFYMTNNSGCAPLGISFINNSSPNDTGSINDMSFIWDFGNGQSSTSVNTNTTFLASQTQDSIYTISLSASTEHSCIDILTKTVRVYPDPVSAFTINNTNGCSPLNASFTNISIPNDTGSINIMNFFWSFGNNMSSNSVNANINYFKSNYQDTNYTIQLIAVNEHNCVDTSYQTITVYPNPVIKFSLNNSNGCGPLNVSFTNQSSPRDTGSIDIMNFLWDFDNGSVSNSKNCSVSYQSSNTNDTIYNVKLVGSTEHGCFDSTYESIYVYPDPKVSFVASTQNGCGPLTVGFTNNSDPGDTSSINDMSFFWDFGNGYTSTTKNNSVTFQKSASQDTVYEVVLMAYTEHGCIGYDTTYITVYPDPVASFSTNALSGCSPLQISFTNQSYPNNGGNISIMNFDWSFDTGDSSTVQNPSYTFLNNQNSNKQFDVTLIAYSDHGCIDSYSQQITVSPAPEVSFYISDSVACNNLSVNFINTSIPHDQAGINKMSFEWDFDNGITSKAKDTTVTFVQLSSGTIVYDIKLKATNTFGCLNTYQNEVTIHTNPVSDFTFNNPKSCGNEVIFINSSSPNDKQNISSMSFSWNFGNQKVGTKMNDTVSFIQSYVQDTTFTITLVAVNTLGCSDTTSKNILIHPKPQVLFSISTYETCSGVNVNFVNKSKNVATRLWMFGDTQTDTSLNPSHAYNNNSPNAYLYNVKLYGESIHGCPGDTFTQNILVHPLQSAGIITSIDSGCSPLSVNFYNNSHNSSLFYWTVDDNLISANTNLNYTFPGSTLQDSVFTVRLIAQNGIGCIDTAVHTIKVYRRTVASFNVQPYQGCSPTQVSFQNQTTGATDYFWNLGNGQTSTSENPSTIYSNYLFYNMDFEVTLFAISSRNCFDTISKHVTVNPIPVASFSADKLQGCDPVVVNFTNQSIISDSIQWNFGNGVTSSLLNPAHAFTTGANDTIYKVKLTVFSEYGCSHSFTKEIKVYASPKANFNFAAEGCAPVSAKFKDESQNAVFWYWQFGDGFTSSEKNPEHTFFMAGEYSVKLRVSNYLGCSDTITLNKNVIVHEMPVANFISDKYYSEYPELTFNFTSTSPTGLLHSWSFGNDRVVMTSNSVSYSFKDTGVYIVSLNVSTQYCSDTTWKQIIIDPPYPIAGFTFDTDEGCIPLTVSFSDTSMMTSGWLWYFGDGTTSNEQHPVHTYSEPGKFSVTLITTNSRGSDAEYKMNIINVHPKPSVYFEASPETAYLPNAKVDLVNLTVGGIEYAWFIDGQFHDSLENTSKTFYTAGTHDVMLFAKSKHGCIDSLIVEDAILVDTMSQVFMPNAFTPNGDGLNDVFKPLGYGYSHLDYTLQIFNRWGEKVFESDDFNDGWNGTFRNQLCSQGIYIYRLSIKLASNETKYLGGQVTLLR